MSKALQIKMIVAFFILCLVLAGVCLKDGTHGTESRRAVMVCGIGIAK